ncbi:hypothetical protein DFQ14_12217 [Halopolyspora algeriensis]|uniref:Uncharacterized protein n=1 Tax=Halopolyspora algeriensis TaxID=1500506 RepID=A0A368VFN4_9ACTN|nr:hypothetical protein DFQ14_12217 [Halopolyspora algeriensis]TQM42645.1 hypothetical protein FHU43_4284 [Halopolyspora algeriensis]
MMWCTRSMSNDEGLVYVDAPELPCSLATLGSIEDLAIRIGEWSASGHVRVVRNEATGSCLVLNFPAMPYVWVHDQPAHEQVLNVQLVDESHDQ